MCNHNHIIAPKLMPAKAIIVRRMLKESRMTGMEAARVAAPCEVDELDAADGAADEED